MMEEAGWSIVLLQTLVCGEERPGHFLAPQALDRKLDASAR